MLPSICEFVGLLQHQTESTGNVKYLGIAHNGNQYVAGHCGERIGENGGVGTGLIL